MTKKRFAAIDIGTNSIRSIVVEADSAGSFKVLDDEKVSVRLGEGLSSNGLISDAARGRAVDALGRLKKIIDGYGVAAIEAVATSAVRKASNGNDFIKEIFDKIGLTVKVISGEEEAELAAHSVFNSFDLDATHQILVDIGGGSLELVTTVGRHIEEIFSLELGAVYLTEVFMTSDPVSEDDLLKLRKHIRRTLKTAFKEHRPIFPTIVGSGGTITSIASMVMAARKEMFGSVHCYELLRSDIVHLLAMLQRKGANERRAIPGLNPDRVDIIIAGVTVIDELMAFLETNLLRVNERGIREGLILKGLQKHGMVQASSKSRSWRASVVKLAESCHYDREHSEQVARLSMELFKPLARPFMLGDKERRILDAAALLHDIGYFITYAAHHKHSYHLIRHADLFGFSPRERELIANVARYHRKSLPKKKHDQFMRLSPDDRQLVCRLGGILRLADGLDRRRACNIEEIEVLYAPSRLQLRLQGEGDLSVELYGGVAKGDLIQEAFNLKLIIDPPVV